VAASRPLIGVTGPDRWFSMAWWATRLAIWLAGGRAIRLRPSLQAQQLHLRVQGVIIGGGDDIEPMLYANYSHSTSKADKVRDDFEIQVIKHALHTRLPLFGICRGAQLINVVLGGDLYTDIRPMRQHTPNRWTPLACKNADLVTDTRLGMTLGQNPLPINSLHNQAIRQLGESLRICARDKDGFVQAVEGIGNRFIAGVQWHPEYLCYQPRQRALFGALVKASRQVSADSLDH